MSKPSVEGSNHEMDKNAGLPHEHLKTHTKLLVALSCRFLVKSTLAAYLLVHMHNEPVQGLCFCCCLTIALAQNRTAFTRCCNGKDIASLTVWPTDLLCIHVAYECRVITLQSTVWSKAWSEVEMSCRYDFPSRLEACQSIISLIQQHPQMDIVLGIDSLGKGDSVTESRLLGHSP